MSKIFIRAMKPEDWVTFFEKGEADYKKEHSAWALAHCWHENPDDFPESIKCVFRESCLPLFQNVELLFAFPEYRVVLPPTRGHASQNDLLVVAKGEGELIAIAVEGKVSEPFDKRVCEWIAQDSQGKKERLSFLCNQLGLGKDQVSQIRYQLLHRTVSAILMARELGARSALMLVHSFSPQNEHFDDYGAFAALYGIEAHPDALYFAKELGGVNLYLGWVKGDSRYLTMEP